MILRFFISQLYKLYQRLFFFLDGLSLPQKKYLFKIGFSIWLYNYITSLGIEDIPNSFWRKLLKYVLIFGCIWYIVLEIESALIYIRIYFSANPTIDLYNEHYPHFYSYVTDLYENIILYPLYYGFDLIFIYLKFNFIYWWEEFKLIFIFWYFNILFLFPYTLEIADLVLMGVVLYKAPSIIYLAPIYPYIIMIYKYINLYSLETQIETILIHPFTISINWKLKALIFEGYFFLWYSLVLFLIYQLSKNFIRILNILFAFKLKKILKKLYIKRFKRHRFLFWLFLSPQFNQSHLHYILIKCRTSTLIKYLRLYLFKNKGRNILRFIDILWFYKPQNLNNFTLKNFLKVIDINFYIIDDYIKFSSKLYKVYILIKLYLIIPYFKYNKKILLIQLQIIQIYKFIQEFYHNSLKYIIYLKFFHSISHKYLNQIYSIFAYTLNQYQDGLRIYKFKIFLFRWLTYLIKYLIIFKFIYCILCLIYILYKVFKIFYIIEFYWWFNFFKIFIYYIIFKLMPYTLLLIILDLYLIIIISLILYFDSVTF